MESDASFYIRKGIYVRCVVTGSVINMDGKSLKRLFLVAFCSKSNEDGIQEFSNN